MKYKIYCDASGDVDSRLISSTGAGIISMQYIIDGIKYTSTGIDSDAEMISFYNKLKDGKLPTTEAISIYQFEEMFTPIMADGSSILYLALSSGLSPTYETALHAARVFKAKYPNQEFIPIDSLSATGGIGVLLEKMLYNQRIGMDIYQNKANIEEYKKHIRTTAYVTDLSHLKRGGRISQMSATFGSMFNIKPLIKMDETGHLVVYEKKRGTKAAIDSLAQEYQLYADYTSVVYVSDADNEYLIDDLVIKIKELNPKAVIKRKKLTTIIGSHIGPEGIAISYKLKEWLHIYQK
jgi:DegV family protein with EDD domain